MKLSNFILEEVRGSNEVDWVYIATVKVTTGILWWKRSQRRVIECRFAGYWYFADTGEFTPGNQAEELERAFAAQNGVTDLHQIALRDLAPHLNFSSDVDVNNF